MNLMEKGLSSLSSPSSSSSCPSCTSSPLSTFGEDFNLPLRGEEVLFVCGEEVLILFACGGRKGEGEEEGFVFKWEVDLGLER